MWAKTALRKLCNDIGLSDEAMTVVREDDGRAFDFDGSASVGTVNEEVVVRVMDADDRADEAERQAAAAEAEAVEDEPPAKKKGATRKKAAKKKAESGESGEGRETESGDAGPRVLETLVKERGKKFGLTVATLVGGAESLEEKDLPGGLADAQEDTLQKLAEMLETEQGSYAIEEHALSWQDRKADVS
jgi:hypothetical protein